MEFKKYSLSQSKITQIARLCVQEQGSVAGVRAEASQAANLLETNEYYRNKYRSDIYAFMRESGWYYKAAYYMDNGSASSAAVQAVKEVLCEGQRVFPWYVDEHDCISDISYIKLRGEKVDKKDKSNYKQGETIIRNEMGSIYTFWSFPAPGCDPFGYTQEAYEYARKHGGMDTDAGADAVIEAASAEVGYLEKASNSQLDSKTANAGDANYTKYARDLYPGLQGQAWCDMFVDWCFVKVYGKEKAKQLLGGFSAYTPDSAQFFKDRGQWHTKDPRKGDVIFFRNTERICHTGIVYKVDGSTVYTIEGNTSAGSQVIPNGGAVCRKSYDISNSRIAGYGRPAYGSGGGEDEKVNKMVSVTCSLPELYQGCPASDAVPLWRFLIGHKGKARTFGAPLKRYTMKWQQANGLTADGIVGKKSWTKALDGLK